MDKEQSGVNRKLVLLGLILGMFFSALEQTVVGTAMPTIVSELNGFSIFAWVTTAYLITSTTVVPIVGKLSDMFGRRVLYLLGILIFVLGSGLCATATTMQQLVLYRGLQGLGRRHDHAFVPDDHRGYLLGGATGQMAGRIRRPVRLKFHRWTVYRWLPCGSRQLALDFLN